MSDRDLEPLPPEIADLLAQERLRALPPTDERARVLSRVQTTLGLAGGMSGGSGSGGESDEGGPTPSGAADGSSGATVGAGAGAAATAAALPSGLLVRPLAMGVAGFVLGTIVGAAGYARLRPVPPQGGPAELAAVASAPAPLDAPVTIASAEIVEPPAAAVTSGPSAVASAPLPTRASAAVPTPTSSSSADAPGRDVDLAAERALLEIARTALARGQSGRALEALQRHATEFPRGRLGEEREALSIQALLAAGRRDEARTRAERFKKTYPRSLLLPAIDGALAPKR